MKLISCLFLVVLLAGSNFAKEESKDKVDVGTVIGIDLGKFLVDLA